MQVMVNEGSFFYETHLVDDAHNIWAWDAVPKAVLTQFSQQLLANKESATPHDIRFVLEAVAREAMYKGYEVHHEKA